MSLIHYLNADFINYTAVSAASPLPTTSGGDVAAGAADSGNPVKVGGVYDSVAGNAVTYTAGQRGNLSLNGRGGLRVYNTGQATAVANGASATTIFSGRYDTNDTTAHPLAILPYGWNGASVDPVKGDQNGLVVQPALSATYWNYAAAASGLANTTTAVTVKAAAGASVRNYIDSLQIQHATLGGTTEFCIRDGAAGTVLWRTQLQTTALPLTTINFNPPLKGTANTLVEIVELTAVTGAIYANLQGHTGA